MGASERTQARLVDRADWYRAVAAESLRVARFGNPVTVVIAELPHLDALSDRLGRRAADQVVAEIARLIESESRVADPIAHLSHGSFGALLLETGEDGATRYIDRVRAAADDWLENAGLTLRLSLGWAPAPALPPAGPGLSPGTGRHRSGRRVAHPPVRSSRRQLPQLPAGARQPPPAVRPAWASGRSGRSSPGGRPRYRRVFGPWPTVGRARASVPPPGHTNPAGSHRAAGRSPSGAARSRAADAPYWPSAPRLRRPAGGSRGRIPQLPCAPTACRPGCCPHPGSRGPTARSGSRPRARRR